MKKEEKFYVIVSKDGKYFTGVSYRPHKLSSNQLSKVAGFKTRDEAEENIIKAIKFYERSIKTWENTKKILPSQTNIANDWIKENRRKLKAIVDGSVKEVTIILEVK